MGPASAWEPRSGSTPLQAEATRDQARCAPGTLTRAVQETQVQPLARKDPLEEGMATHASVLAWRIPMDRGAWRATVHGVSKSQTQLTVQLDYKESSDRLLSFCVPKSLRIGTAAVKLKNTCFLEETLCPTQAAY